MRTNLLSCLLALAVTACSADASERGRGGAAAKPAAGAPQSVTLVEFSNAGARGATVTVPKVVKSDEEWRRQLPELSYRVTRHAHTERAFTGPLDGNKAPGIYRCVACGNALYSSAAKFDSGTGWPSFWQPIAPENVRTESDYGLLLPRTEVLCAKCDAHLGHVFDDGPPPTGKRYCMNSAALTFSTATPE